MRVRLVSLKDEYQFLTCFQHKLWGSKNARFAKWLPNDYVVFIVEKRLAGLAQVTGNPFVSREQVWDNGVYHHRLPIEFVQLLSPEDRAPILGDMREALIAKSGGASYGFLILNQVLIEGRTAKTIIDGIRSKPNRITEYAKNLTAYLQEANLKRDVAQAKKPSTRKRKKRKDPVKDESREDVPTSKREASTHTKAQADLVELGRTVGCSTWIASNDRSKIYKKKRLGDLCIDELPGMGLSEEAVRRISLIDAIWIDRNAPVSAFEVESTTSIYSGLLRMSDLLAVVPALNIRLYIVAPKKRQDKVLQELSRPTFQRIGLSEYCRYVSCEDLSQLLQQVKGLEGSIKPSVIDSIAIELEVE